MLIGKNKKIVTPPFIVLALMLLVISSLSIPTEAHMPGAKAPPEFELTSIEIDDNGTLLEMSIDDVAEYHGERTGKETQICLCLSCAFRAVQLGISEVWGEEMPQRNDIKIISVLPTPGSAHVFQYITGTGPNIPNVTTKGDFEIVLPDGTEITNMSNKNLKKTSKNNTLDNFKFNISRKSTGEYFEVTVKEGVFPDDFFELRKKIKFSIPENPTDEDKSQFKSEWEDTRDKFLTQPDWELFEGVEEPEEDVDVIGGTMFFSILVIALILITLVTYKRR